MSFKAATLVYVFVFVSLVVIGCTNADQQKPSSFLSSYDSYKNICHKIGWEPKCGKQPFSGCRHGKVIAFQAFLTKRLLNVAKDTIIKFERVLVNEGSGYNSKNGKFTAPVDGTYSFSWTYCTSQGSNAHLGGYVDGVLTTYISNYGQSSAWKSTSGHLLVTLKKGNQFWIQTYGYTAQLIQKDYTFLSGYKISGC